MAGLTGAGFEAKSLAEIKEEIEAELRTHVSPNIDLSPESPNGQMVGVLAGQFRKLWELGQQAYSAAYADTSSGWSLDQVAALTGTTREAAKPSTVEVEIQLDAGTYLAGSLVAVVDGDATARFFNPSDITLLTGQTITTTFVSENTGPVRANAGTLTVIAEAVAGWGSVTNPLDAVQGSVIESDADLRARRELELARKGSTNVDAIRVDLLDVLDVISATVLANDTDYEDDNGLPPHSIEAIVRGGDDADVAKALWTSKSAGTGTTSQGGTTVTEGVLDSEGVSHVVTFTRPAVVNIYLRVYLTVDALRYGGDTSVKEALVDYGDSTFVGGSDVIASRLVAAIFQVPGVVDVTLLQLGTAPVPVGTSNLAIGLREIADLDTTRITVTVA